MLVELKNIRKYSVGRKGIKKTDMKNIPIFVNAGFKRTDGTPGVYAEENYQRRIKYRQNAIREICQNNFTADTAVHITLTFDTKKCGVDVTDISKTHKLFHLFVKRVNRAYDDFCYIATFAQQNNKNWHYHLICNLPINDNKALQEITQIWQYGRVDVNKITSENHYNNSIKYLIRNMNTAANELNGERGYLSSRNAKRNIVFSSARAKDAEIFAQFDEGAQELIMKPIYTVRNQRIGVITDIYNEDTLKEFYKDPQKVLEQVNPKYKPLLMDLTISYYSIKKNTWFPEPQKAKKKPAKSVKRKAKKPRNKQSPQTPPTPANKKQKSNSTEQGIKSTKSSSKGGQGIKSENFHPIFTLLKWKIR